MNIDSQQLREDYEIQFMHKVQLYAYKRAEICTQKEMSELTGKSLRTIQKFENYKCFDAYLLFCYKKILNL